MYSSTHLSRLGLHTTSHRNHFHSHSSSLRKASTRSSTSSNSNLHTKRITLNAVASSSSSSSSSSSRSSPSRTNTLSQIQQQFNLNAEQRLQQLLKRQRSTAKSKNNSKKRKSPARTPSDSSLSSVSEEEFGEYKDARNEIASEVDDDYLESSTKKPRLNTSNAKDGKELSRHESTETTTNDSSIDSRSMLQDVNNIRERTVILIDQILNDSTLSNEIEEALYLKHHPSSSSSESDPSVSSNYRIHVRDLLFNFRNNPLLCKSLQEKAISKNELVAMETGKLANANLTKQRLLEQEIEHEERILKPMSGTYTEEHRCPSCKEFKCEFKVLKESRGAAKADTWGSKDDTDSVIKLRCLQCLREWTKEY